MQHQYTGQAHPPAFTMSQVPTTLPPLLRYRAFPVEKGKKKPAVTGWKAAPTDAAERDREERKYCRKFAENPVGLRLGLYLGIWLVVVDLDALQHLTDYLTGVLEKWPWRVLSYRGYHCYGTPPEDMRYAKKRYSWGEYLTAGDFVMAPGSQHPSGVLYDPAPGFGQGPPPRFPAELLRDLGLRGASRWPPRSPPVPKPPALRPTRARTPRPRPLPPGGGDYTKPTTPAGSLGNALFEDLSHEAYRLWPDRQPRPCTLEEWTGQVVKLAIEMAETMGFTDDAAVLDTAERVAEWIWDHFDRSTYRGQSPENKGRPGTAQYSHLPYTEERRRSARYGQLKGAENRRARKVGKDDEVRRLASLGLSQRQIAAKTGVPKSTVQGILARVPGIAATRAEIERALR